MDYQSVQIIRSARKSMALEIRPDAGIIVRAPMKLSEKKIREFVVQHEAWIEKHLAEIKKQAALQEPVERLTTEELQKLASQALAVIPQRVAYYAPKVGVTYGRITIRNQRTKWGSCSSKGNLNFNCLLMLAPPEVLDSVVVHELCHRKEMNHSDRFYAEVLRVYPEYHKWNRWLKEHGSELIRRMTGI